MQHGAHASRGSSGTHYHAARLCQESVPHPQHHRASATPYTCGPSSSSFGKHADTLTALRAPNKAAEACSSRICGGPSADWTDASRARVGANRACAATVPWDAVHRHSAGRPSGYVVASYVWTVSAQSQSNHWLCPSRLCAATSVACTRSVQRPSPLGSWLSSGLGCWACGAWADAWIIASVLLVWSPTRRELSECMQA